VAQGGRLRKERKMKEKTWLFNWRGGGYNTVKAKTIRGARKAAEKLGEPFGLTAYHNSFRVATGADVEEEDRVWGPYD
jgi:hypothetical protein